MLSAGATQEVTRQNAAASTKILHNSLTFREITDVRLTNETGTGELGKNREICSQFRQKTTVWHDAFVCSSARQIRVIDRQFTTVSAGDRVRSPIHSAHKISANVTSSQAPLVMGELA